MLTRITQTTRRMYAAFGFPSTNRLWHEIRTYAHYPHALTDEQRAGMSEVHRRLGNKGPWLVPLTWMQAYTGVVYKFLDLIERR